MHKINKYLVIFVLFSSVYWAFSVLFKHQVIPIKLILIRSMNLRARFCYCCLLLLLVSKSNVRAQLTAVQKKYNQIAIENV